MPLCGESVEMVSAAPCPGTERSITAAHSSSENARGHFALYTWNQWKSDYALVEEIPAEVREIVDRLKDEFDIPDDEELTHAMFTFYFNGREHCIPLFQE